MASRARGIRLPRVLEQEIEREARERGQSWTSATLDLLEEAIRMRRAPGIIFADGAAGRRAVVAGSGLDVWEIIAVWQEERESFAELRGNFPWLSDPQLRAALGYYKLYPKEIDARLESERAWTPERLRKELPFAQLRDQND